ncbi:hypothetical protein [Enterococcus thailandicus]|uniref:Uncharacterized protein n=1 Tax=Enterococcus thailandicus TaxID=417368 RepID=A0A179EPT9_ENTTH|nr:hypothetical protein [Enterococcus thailandicus]MDK4351335.1 hypothetical protein [Enterococcus thailandicus]MDT2732932.1 hypothetical protein [Enterococcus thailandicus]MDT2752009.1 hypothetical protein [Enterococcus thailandicus]MDT2777113.1 hypothetical protein [Enterococcus thailandicus]MDT2794057.1 hypothetical protein [Enterococcus thailandicus]
MKKKYLGLKVWVRVIAVTFVLSIVATSGSMIVSANELFPDETQNSESYFNDEDLAIYYSKEEKNSELALEKIKEKYGDVPPKFNEDGEILLTPEDELRMEQAISQYLAMTGFNPRMRGVGKNWWNSTGFVAGVIDVGLIAIGLWTAASNFGAVRTLLRNNRKNITRMVEKQILSKVGIGVGGFLNSMIDIALVISGASVGGILAEGLDRADGKNDNYILA